MNDRLAAARFVPGFVGVPGERTFLIEVESVSGRAWYLLEKGQVAAFAQQSAVMLAEFGLINAGLGLDPGPLNAPESVEFRVAHIDITYREDDGLVDIILVPTDENAPSTFYTLTPAQLDAAARLGGAAVAEGRPKCPRCGLAMDPDGHVCPTTNGDLRDHRP